MSAEKIAIVAALEALEAGDTKECETILLGALEDGSPARAIACPECGLAFDWPGQVADHRRRVHEVAA